MADYTGLREAVAELQSRMQGRWHAAPVNALAYRTVMNNVDEILVLHPTATEESVAQIEARVLRAVADCHCVNVAMGSYDNTVDMRTPFDLPHRDDRWVVIDTCIATEIGWLWHQGVVTLNSCCGHQKIPGSVIVAEESYALMDHLGYEWGLAPSGRRAHQLGRLAEREVHEAVGAVVPAEETKVSQIREVFVEAMIEHELDNQARENKGALVSLTAEYRESLADALGKMFDAALAEYAEGGAR